MENETAQVTTEASAPVTETTAAPAPAPTTTTTVEAPAPEKPAAEATASAPVVETPKGDTTAKVEETTKVAEQATTDDLTTDLSAIPLADRQKYAAELAKLDPAARKVFNRLYTQQSQAAAAAATRAQAAIDLIEEIKADPEKGIEKLKAKLAPKPAEHTTVPKVSAEMVKAIEDQLDETAKPFAPIVAPMISAVLEQRLGPIQEWVEQQKKAAELATAATVVAEFERAHPDWNEHHEKMKSLSEEIPIGSMAPNRYLEVLYNIASGPTRDAKAQEEIKKAKTERTDKVIEKAVKAAEAAEPDTSTVQTARVTKRHTGPVTMKEAYEAAKAGQVLEFE